MKNEDPRQLRITYGKDWQKIVEKMNQSCKHDLGDWIVETDRQGFHSGYRNRRCMKCKQIIIREKLGESYD